MKRRFILPVLLLAAMLLLGGCAQQTVDLTGSWVGTGSNSSGLRATITSSTILIKYQPSSSLSKVIWSGSYSPAKGDPATFVSQNDYAYTKYLGTISDPELTFTYENNRLTFSSKPMVGETKRYTLVRP